MVHDLNLHSVDLNLLVSLDALLELRSVQRAARRARLSQSAMSRVLGRLRELFADELLIRTGNEMVPTSRALAIQPALRTLLGDTKTLLAGNTPVPANFEGTVTVLMNDHVGRLVLPALLAAVQKGAPRLNLAIRHPGAFPGSLLMQGEAELWVDVAIEELPGLNNQPLYEEGLTCLVRRNHSLASGRKGAATWAAARHGQVSVRGWGESPVDQKLAEMGLSRRIVVTVPSFGLAALLAATSDLVFTLPSRLARELHDARRLAAFPPPFDLEPMTTRMIWHRRSDADPRATWVREQLLSCYSAAKAH